MKKLNLTQAVLYFILTGLIIYFSGCKISREHQYKKDVAAAIKYTDKALGKDTPTVLRKVRVLVPCIVTSSSTDSSKYLDWLKQLGDLPENENYNDSVLLIHDTVPVVVNGNCSEMIGDMSIKINGLQVALEKRNERNKILEGAIEKIKNNPPPPIEKKESIADKSDSINYSIENRRLAENNAEKDKNIATLEKKVATKKASVTILGVVCLLFFLGLIFLTYSLIKNKK